MRKPDLKKICFMVDPYGVNIDCAIPESELERYVWCIGKAGTVGYYDEGDGSFVTDEDTGFVVDPEYVEFLDDEEEPEE